MFWKFGQANFVLWSSVLWMGAVAAARGQETVDQEPMDQEPMDVEVLTRGPLHEAFAAPLVFDPTPGAVTPQSPPESIDELPPDEKPDGEAVVWIPGYWSFDDERQDFIWVSGFWRNLPPSRQWVPGYWSQVAGGSRWISGFWAPAASQDAEYLPPPPRSVEAGPSSDAPSPDHIYVPGSWRYVERSYAWRPGYWIAARPEWVWVPAQYVWTPAGCVYVDGYWDFAPEERGLLFAPVYVPPVLLARPGFVFGPSITLDVGLVFDYSFCRPRYRHYYFGDYYAAEYIGYGVYPAFSFHMSAYGYDPLWAHRVVFHSRFEPGYVIHVRERFIHRRRHVDARPPRTYVNQVVKVKNIQKNVVKNKTVIKNSNINVNSEDADSFALGRPLGQPAAKAREGGKGAPPLKKISRENRDQERNVANGMRRQAQERRQLEVAPPTGNTGGEDRMAQGRRLKIPESPVNKRMESERRPASRPPDLPERPKTDPRVKPPAKDAPTPRPYPKDRIRREKQQNPQPGIKPGKPPEPAKKKGDG